MASKLDTSIKAAMDLIAGTMGLEYEVNDRFDKIARRIIEPKEDILFAVRQSFIQNISPKIVFVTNKRIIIMHPSFWYRYAGFNLFSPTT